MFFHKVVFVLFTSEWTRNLQLFSAYSQYTVGMSCALTLLSFCLDKTFTFKTRWLKLYLKLVFGSCTFFRLRLYTLS